MSRYRFAFRPRWILSHLFVASLLGAMITAGLWQLERRDEKRERNDRVLARSDQPVADATDLAEPGDFAAVDDLEFRRVTATGSYLVDDEVLVRARSLNGAPGSWVLTPLQVADGTLVMVNRGWISNSGELVAVPDDVAAPSGDVTVSGLVRASETRGSFGSTDPAEGVLTDLARADVARIDQQVEGDAVPFWLQLQSQDPEVTVEDPAPVPAPELDEGPHFSYAVQWFTFTTMTVIVYGLILRRRAREDERDRIIESLDRPDPADVAVPGDPRLDTSSTPSEGPT